jgi:hypothetical protein
MPCGGCSKRRAARTAARSVATAQSEDPLRDLTGGYANLNDRQLKARLEVYKKRFCKDCKERYTCDFSRYMQCKKLK